MNLGNKDDVKTYGIFFGTPILALHLRKIEDEKVRVMMNDKVLNLMMIGQLYDYLLRKVVNI